jgi:ABC-type methionine transport system permease subunit
VCAAVLAAAVSIATKTHNEGAAIFVLHDLFWPDQFSPLIMFVSVFLSLLPVLLAYYHLGRLGAMLCLCVSVIMWYAMIVCAVLAFVTGGVWLGAVAYGAACSLFYLLVLRFHMRAAASHAVQDAQRALHLFATANSHNSR